MTQPTYDWNSNPDAVERIVKAAVGLSEAYEGPQALLWVDDKNEIDRLFMELRASLNSIKVDPVEAIVERIACDNGWDPHFNKTSSEIVRRAVLAGIELGEKEARS